MYEHLSTQKGTEEREGAPRRFGGTQPVNGSDLTGAEKGETAARLPLVRRTPNRVREQREDKRGRGKDKECPCVSVG